MRTLRRRWLWTSFFLLVAFVGGCTQVTLPVPSPSPTVPEATSTPEPTLLPPTATPTPPALAPQTRAPAEPALDPAEREAIIAVVTGQALEGYWSAHGRVGRFTAPDVTEQLAMVGGIGEEDEVRWVIVGQTEAGWELRGLSPVLAWGFEAPPPSYLPPELIDLDRDGQQEILSRYFNLRGGWLMGADTLYRWDGTALVPIWAVTTTLDTTAAGAERAPVPYRQAYDAAWRWEDLDGDGFEEIVVEEEMAFYLPGEEGYVPEGAPPTGGESTRRAYRWDGHRFRPYAPNAPTRPFVYRDADDLWLWEPEGARPLAGGAVETLSWSPDGAWLAWIRVRFEAPPELGLYEWETETFIRYTLDVPAFYVQWLSEEELLVAQGEKSALIVAPETGHYRLQSLPASGVWSPDSLRLLYSEEPGLRLYDLEQQESRLLVHVPPDAGVVSPVVSAPLWSPTGERIALRLENVSGSWVGVVEGGSAEPAAAAALVEPFAGREAAGLRRAWAPDGSQLAALTLVAEEESPIVALHLAEFTTGRPLWTEVFRTTADGPLTWADAAEESLAVAWAPDGERMIIAVGQEIWEVTREGESRLRHTFAFPQPRWETLTWSPDGSGFLLTLSDALYLGRSYWFPEGEAPPVLLTVGAPQEARWQPVNTR